MSSAQLIEWNARVGSSVGVGVNPSRRMGGNFLARWPCYLEGQAEVQIRISLQSVLMVAACTPPGVAHYGDPREALLYRS